MNTKKPAMSKGIMGDVGVAMLSSICAPLASVPAGMRGVMTSMVKPSDDVFREGDAASQDPLPVRVQVALNDDLVPAQVRLDETSQRL